MNYDLEFVLKEEVFFVTEWWMNKKNEVQMWKVKRKKREEEINNHNLKLILTLDIQISVITSNYVPVMQDYVLVLILNLVF